MIKPRRSTWASLLLAVAVGVAPTSTPLPLGPVRIGFAVQKIGSKDPLQIATWYPASRGGAALRYGDLLDLAASEATVPRRQAKARLAETRGRYAEFMAGVGVDSLKVARLRALPMAARRDAPTAGRSRPLVIIVQGNGQAVADQTFLAEYLASYGFVVATSPSVTRRRGPPASEDAVGSMAELQADDIARIVARMRRRPDVDARRLGLIGHSFGARGALLFQMRTRAASALVSLDGGIGTATGLVSMQTAASFNAARFTIPVLHFFETLSPQMAPEWSLLSSLPGSVTIGRVEDLRHHHFTDLGGIVGAFPDLVQAVQATPRTATAYRAVAAATLAFLQRELRPAGRRTPVVPMVESDSLLKLSPLGRRVER